MSVFGIVHGVPTTATIARYTVDRFGELRCESCDPELMMDAEGKFRVLERECDAWASCGICGRSPWDSRVVVPATATVEYVACKIF